MFKKYKSTRLFVFQVTNTLSLSTLCPLPVIKIDTFSVFTVCSYIVGASLLIVSGFPMLDMEYCSRFICYINVSILRGGGHFKLSVWTTLFYYFELAFVWIICELFEIFIYWNNIVQKNTFRDVICTILFLLQKFIILRGWVE